MTSLNPPLDPTRSTLKPPLRVALRELIYLRPLILVVPMTVAGMLAGGPLQPGRLLLTIALMVITDAGANVINNYSDWEIDRMNGKREAMHAVFTKGSLVRVYLGLLATAALILVALSADVFLVACAAGFALLGALYSVGPKLKDRSPWNYAAIAIAYAGLAFYIGLFAQTSALDYTSAESREALWAWLPVVLEVVLFDLGYSITKDYVDYEGDLHFGKRTLPVILGRSRSVAVQGGIIGASYLLLAVLLALGRVSPAFALFFLSLGVAMYMLYKTGRATSKDELRAAFYIAGYNGMFVRLILIVVLLLGAGQTIAASV